MKEFDDFAGFKMIFSSGESMFGGNTATIYFNSIIVFKASYWLDIQKDCKVSIFHDEKEWLPQFMEAIRNKKEVLAAKNRREKRKAAKQKRRIEKEEENRATQAAAARLGMK